MSSGLDKNVKKSNKIITRGKLEQAIANDPILSLAFKDGLSPEASDWAKRHSDLIQSIKNYIK